MLIGMSLSTSGWFLVVLHLLMMHKVGSNFVYVSNLFVLNVNMFHAEKKLTFNNFPFLL